MAEQARRTIISLTDSLMNDSVLNESVGVGDFSLSDETVLSDTVFEEAMEMSTNLDVSALDITDSVSEQIDAIEEDSNVESNEALTKAFNTSNKRFERAIGNRIINNDVIKLKPVN